MKNYIRAYPGLKVKIIKKGNALGEVGQVLEVDSAKQGDITFKGSPLGAGKLLKEFFEEVKQ